MKISSDFKPHCVFMQIGGNDLVSEADPSKLARDIVSFADYIMTCFQVRHGCRSITSEIFRITGS